MRYNIDGSIREETAAEKAEAAYLSSLNDNRSRNRRTNHQQQIGVPSKEYLLLQAKEAIASHKQLHNSQHVEASTKSSHYNPPGYSNTCPWGSAADKILFGKDTAEAQFKRGSGEFFDFIDFYKKFKAMKVSQTEFSVDEYILIARQALALFEEFQQKRLKKTREKIIKVCKIITYSDLDANVICKDRAALPIKSYEDTIVNMVTNNRVVLIAADTG